MHRKIRSRDRQNKAQGITLSFLAAVSIAASGAIVQHSGLGGNVATFGTGVFGVLSGLIGFFAREKSPFLRQSCSKFS